MISALEANWAATLPKFKFQASNGNADPATSTQALTINKYSVWVAGAVNMGIIRIDQLTDLTDTSFASAYAVPVDDDEFAEVRTESIRAFVLTRSVSIQTGL